MDEIGEARLLEKDNMVLDVWYYFYAYVVYVVHVASMMCELVVLCINSMCTCYLCNVMYMMVQIGLWEYCIWGVVNILYSLHYLYAMCLCIWFYVHVGYVVLCTYFTVCMMNMQCFLHMVLCTCWISSAVCRWCYVHVGYAVLCTSGVACMWYIGTMYIWHGVNDFTSGVVCMWWWCIHCIIGNVFMWWYVHVMHVALCTCGVAYMSWKWYCIHVVHMVLVHVWYCVHVMHVVSRACGIMYVHHVVMVFWHVCLLCSTLCRYMHWVVFHIGYRLMHCILYTGCRCMCCMLVVEACIAWCGIPCCCMCVLYTMCLCTWLRIRLWVFVECRN